MVKKRRESKFRGVVSEAARQRKEARSKYGYLQLPKGVSVFKVEDTKQFRVDILPYVVTEKRHPLKVQADKAGGEWYRRPFRVHKNVGANHEAIICPTSIERKCPICEYRMKKVSEQVDIKVTDALKFSLRNLYVVIPLDSKKYEEKPHVWDIADFLFERLLSDEVDIKNEYEVFMDLEVGYTLMLRFEEKRYGKNPYFNIQRIDFEERDEAYDESIRKKIPDLDSMLHIPDYKEIEEKFFELENEERGDEEDEEDDVDVDEKEEDEETPRRRKKAEPEEEEEETPRRRKKVVPEEEEEEEKPKRKKRIRGAKDDRCPHGHRFGIDTEKFEECLECEEWDPCIEKKEVDKEAEKEDE